MLERVVSGLVVILLVFSLGVNAQYEMWIPYVPQPDQVQFRFWRENDISYMDVSILFCSSGYNISDWGTPTIAGNNISVDAEIWQWTGWVYLWCWTAYNTYTLGNLTVDKYVFTFKVWEHHVKNLTFNIYVNATIDFRPQVLTLWSTGLFMAYTELPEIYDLNTINISSILLNDTIPADPSGPINIEDYDNDSVSDVMVEFNRTEIYSYILTNVDMKELYEVKIMTITLTMTGCLNGDVSFQGSSIIIVLVVMPSGINKYIVPI